MPPAFPPYLATGLLGFAVIASLTVLARTRRRRLLPGAWAPVTTREPAPDVLAEIAPWLARLAHFGFRPVVLQRSVSSGHAEGIRWILTNEGECSFATLDRYIPSKGAAHPRFELSFFTAEPGGTVHVTLDRAGMRRVPFYWSLVQNRYRKLESQWQDHQARLPEMASRALPPAERLPALLAADEKARRKALLESGGYLEREGRELQPKWRAVPGLILRQMLMLFRGGSQSRLTRRDISTAERGPDTPPPALTLEEAVERDLSRYRKLSSTHRPGDFLRRWVMVGTAIAALTLLFGRETPGQTAAIAAGLCALHEFGHWLMMRLLRFRGLHPIFIPFSGDIDRARKLHAPAWQHLIVILAGPLPGLLAGMGLCIASLLGREIAPQLLEAAGLAMVLNSFHLLPFLPLDGGRIVDLLFFRDVPWLRPVFTIFSGAAALAGSLALKSRFMRQIAFAFFGGLIWDLRTISVVRGARKIAWAGELTDEDEALRRAFRSVREEGNSGFVGSYGWHYKIDAMLAEVMRRRPGFITRFMGGGLYAVVCAIPLVAIIAWIAGPLLPQAEPGRDLAVLTKPFRDVFPVEQDAAVNPSPIAELDHLTQVSRQAAGPLTNLAEDLPRREVSVKLMPALSDPLAKVNWADAGVMLRRGELSSASLAIWFEILSTQMEAACAAGRDEEALHRAEVILYANSNMEPVPSLEVRERCRDAEKRALSVAEQESATGKVEVKRLRALRDRIKLLHKEPLPAIDNYLLVKAWEDQVNLAHLQGLGKTSKWDFRFWRDLPERTQTVIAQFHRPSSPSIPAVVAIAQFWQTTGRVGELPPTLEDRVTCTQEESELVFRFSESLKEITWRRMTALNALELEASRRQTGKFPQIVRYSVPGGASLELVREGGPWLCLIDMRDPSDRQPPLWLIPENGRDLQPAKPLDHRAPLFGAPRASNLSMQ